MTDSIIFPVLSELTIKLDCSKLDGADGENREKNLKCQIKADNDLSAIYCWLEQYSSKETTFKNYKKEAERLLLWCIKEKNKALSSLNSKDLEDYFNFLQKPPEHWCSENGSKKARHHPGWRPLVKPLKGNSLSTTISVISSLMEFLFKARYLEFNPLSLMRGIKKRATSLEESKIKVLDRILEEHEWELFKEGLLALPEETSKEIAHKARLRFVVAILFLLGLRINELATHNWSSFRKRDNVWWFYVKGKGDKLGAVPVNHELLMEIETYRLSLSLTPLPQSTDDFAIITSVRNKKPIATRQLYRLLKRFAVELASSCTDIATQEKFKRFSPHWLRHLSATHQDKAGMLFKHIKANHRHANENTTRKYVHVIDKERHEDMQRLKLFSI